MKNTFHFSSVDSPTALNPSWPESQLGELLLLLIKLVFYFDISTANSDVDVPTLKVHSP